MLFRSAEPRAATVRVLQPSRLGPPSVVFAEDFEAVTVDGRAWDWFDGRTVFLPDRAATWRVHGHRRDAAHPHVRSTQAPLRRCEYVAERRELVLDTAVDDARPVELPWTAVLTGPVPIDIENGEVVDDPTLRWPDSQHLEQARAGGVLIRFRSGITKVRYAE